MKKAGRKVKNRTDTVCTGKSNMKKTALTLILVSTFSHAEQFVVIYRTVVSYDSTRPQVHSYALSVQPLEKNAKIFSPFYEDKRVKENINFATFVKEVSSNGTSLDEDNVNYIGGAKNISGWKYIYRVSSHQEEELLRNGGEVWFPEMPYLALQTDRPKYFETYNPGFTGFPTTGTLLPSVKYSIKHSSYLTKKSKSSRDDCPQKTVGLTTVEWGSYKLSYKEFCGVVNH
jgi:hypothetical protein